MLGKGLTQAMRYHVGFNMPGHLPGSETVCVEDPEGAITALKDAAQSAGEEHFEAHANGCVKSEEDIEKECECEEYRASVDALAVLSAIADGDVAYALRNLESVGYTRYIGRYVYWVDVDKDCTGCESVAA